MRERAERPSDVVHEVREANHGSSNEIQMERLLLYPFCSVCILVNAYKLVQQTIPHKQFPSTPLGLLVAHPRSVWNAYQFLEGTSYLASIALHPEQFPAVLLSLSVCVSIVQTPAGCGESARKSPYGVESSSAGHFAPHVPFALSTHAAPPLHGSGAQCESQSALRSSDRQNAWNESRIDVYSELGAQRKRLVHRNGAGRRFLPRLCVRLCELFPTHFPNQQAQADFGSTADDSIDRKPRQVRSANQSEAAGLCRRIGVNGMCSTRTTISCWKSYRSMSESSK